MCIIVTDRDGTPVISAKADDAAIEIGLATKPTFLATFTMATDQAGKLGLGKNQSIVCMYSNYQVVYSYPNRNHFFLSVRLISFRCFFLSLLDNPNE